MAEERDEAADGPVKVVDRRWWVRQRSTEAGAGAAQAGAGEAAPSLKPTYVEDLERQLAERDRQLQDVLLKYREASREFDDARARLRKEVAKDVERGRRTMLLELLDVLDNLDRAIEAGRAAAPDDPLLQGVGLVRDQFLAKLGGFGVSRIDAVDSPFDPARHEAVTTVPTNDPERDHVVCGVVRPGYLIGDEVLRPAQVAVAQVDDSAPAD
jgi:molecular chaperone GrpE